MNFSYEFRKVSATATLFIFNRKKGLLVATRRRDAEVYPGCLSAPGGFVEAGWDGENPHPGETVEAAAVREVREELNIEITEGELKLLTVISDPKLDPRCHVINVCFMMALDDDRAELVYPGDDIEHVQWTKDVSLLNGNWAFNHLDLMLMAEEKAYRENY